MEWKWIRVTERPSAPQSKVLGIQGKLQKQVLKLKELEEQRLKLQEIKGRVYRK